MNWFRSAHSTLPIKMCAFVVVGLSLTSAVAVETSLQGWGDYRFGMTPDQVRALPGSSWSRLETKPGLGFFYMNGISTTSIEGRNFKALVTFDGGKKLLKSVTFTEAEAIRPFSECERGFQDLLRKFETRYGSFSPDIKPKKELGATVEWRTLSGGTSKYLILRPDSGNGFHLEAKRHFAQASVMVYVDAGGNNCKINIEFNQG
jgi:hypothetical protein